jgi:hypothetical protein
MHRFIAKGTMMIFRRLATLVIGLALAACSTGNAAMTPTAANAGAERAGGNLSGAAATAYAYVVTFYPLWFTYNQHLHATTNRPVGPVRMGPLYQEVVAPNDDTLYASSYLELSAQPVILTIPRSKVLWSLLSTDPYGDVNDTGIASSGLYALTGPGWSGTLPSGATQVKIPTSFSQLIIRADKYSENGSDRHVQADEFRRAIHIATLSDYNSNPDTGKTLIVPLAALSIPYKTIADDTIKSDPMKFLKGLQTAVHSTNTPPLDAKDKALSAQFDALLDAANPDTVALSAGARQAHAAIVNCYLSATGTTKWVTFDDIGTTWTDLQRSAITEFLQYGNNISAAAYYQAFADGKGVALNGSQHSYAIRFPKNQIPQAKRFWSITAYTPNSITLISNAANKYVVGSYTPGLQKNKDGSITVYIAPSLPTGAPAANWLPSATGPFNVMLRVYGPQGNTVSGTYVPPAVQIRK